MSKNRNLTYIDAATINLETSSIKRSPEQILGLNIIYRAYWDIVYYEKNKDISNINDQARYFAKDAKAWIISDNYSIHSFLWWVENCFHEKKAQGFIDAIRKLCKSADV